MNTSQMKAALAAAASPVITDSDTDTLAQRVGAGIVNTSLDVQESMHDMGNTMFITYQYRRMLRAQRLAAK